MVGVLRRRIWAFACVGVLAATRPPSALELAVLHFPHDRSIGTVIVTSPDSTTHEAKGIVAVPRDAVLSIDLDRRAGGDLSVLEDLPGLDVRGLSLHGTKLTSLDLRRVAQLAGLLRLDLGWPPLNNGGLSQLRELKKLRWLDLGNTHINDAGLHHLVGLTSLEGLNLSLCPVGDAGVARLTALQSLKRLQLLATEVTGAGATHIGKLTVLEELDLRNLSLSGGLAGLVNLQSLRVLDLSGAHIGSGELSHLSDLPHLEELYLGMVPIHPEAYPHLGEMQSLRVLDLT